MKKLFLLLLLCGCSNNTIETIIDNDNKVAINYPKTEIKSLNKEIEQYVNDIYELSKKEKYTELNIDYKYSKYDSYISVALFTTIDSGLINKVKTYVYDCNKKRLINFEEIKSKQELISKYKDIDLMSKVENFIIEKDSIKIYIQEDNQIKELELDNPVSKVIDPNKKVIAITFDDGPSKYTNKILEILDKYNSSATFFVLGNKAEIYNETLNNIILKGSEIGNHSYNHKWMARLDEEEILFQINKTQDIVKNLTNYTPTLLRPTYGSVNNKIRKLTNMKIVLWNVDSNDWKIRNGKKIANKVLKKVKDLDIILFHDTYESTYKAIEIIIPKLINEGYTLVTVSELNEIKLLRGKL